MGEFQKHTLDDKAKCSVNGYVGVYYPDHPFCWQNGLVYEHRLVMENNLGRFLTEDEIVHHKDENRSNNNLDNLELTTDAEHKRTHNLKHGKFTKLALSQRTKRLRLAVKNCAVCGNEFNPHSRDAKYCSHDCHRRSSSFRKIEWPDKSELEKLVWIMPVRDVAAKLGVSDVAVHKMRKRLEIEKPPRGYWLRKQQ